MEQASRVFAPFIARGHLLSAAANGVSYANSLTTSIQLHYNTPICSSGCSTRPFHSDGAASSRLAAFARQARKGARQYGSRFMAGAAVGAAAAAAGLMALTSGTANATATAREGQLQPPTTQAAKGKPLAKDANRR